MTISSQTRRVGPYTGNSVTTAFPFTFRVFTAADVAVVKTSTLGAESTLLINADYSITLNADQSANPGGTVTYPLTGALLAAGEHLTLLGSLPAVQGTDITNTGGFYPEVVEDALDYLTILIQQLKEVVARAFVSAVSTTGSPITLPAPVANLFIKWNAAATNLENANPYASPALTGVPTAPTAAALTNTTQIATTAFVETEIAPKAPLASPALTGVPTAPTAVSGTSTTQLATTAFTQQEIAALIASAPATLDTLNELAVALGADPNFATTMATALGLKAPLASPTLTGVPAAPTAAAATNTTQLATTAFVQGELVAKAPLASPVFTGNPTGPTPSPGDSDTSLATTAFVQGELTAKAPLASPTLTGVPAAPTAAGSTNTTQIATTAFVQGELVAKAPLASPALTDNPTAPTQAPGDNDTSIATTAFVTAAVISGGGVTGTANEVTVSAGVVSLPAAMTLTGKTLTGGSFASPTLTGDPVAPTPAQGDNDTSLATTAFVIGEENKHKNMLLNGDFRVWQRGTSLNPVASAASYQADRWYTHQVGGTTGQLTVSQQLGDGTSTYCMRIARTTGTVTDTRHRQVLETQDALKLQGRTITVSYRARKGSGYSAASSNLLFVITTGAGNDQGSSSRESGGWTGQATPVSVNDVLTTSFQTFTHSYAVPATVSQIDVGWQPTWVGTGAGTDYFEIADVQLEVGNAATAFEYQSFGNVLQRCQRYYEKSFPYATTPAQNLGVFQSGATRGIANKTGTVGNILSSFGFSVKKRMVPTMTIFNPLAANAQFRDSIALADCSGSTLNAVESGAYPFCSGNAATVPGNSLDFGWTADAEL